MIQNFIAILFLAWIVVGVPAGLLLMWVLFVRWGTRRAIRAAVRIGVQEHRRITYR